MGANPNTQTLKQVWFDQYQLTHYKQPAFRAICDEKRFTAMLNKGDTIHWSYMSDFYVNNMGGDGSYTAQAQADTDETLVINTVKEVSFYEFQKDLEQAHYQVKAEYARKAMNKIFLQIDADVLLQAYQNAGNIVDSGIISGGSTNATPIVLAITNIFTTFSYALLQLQLNNVLYTPNSRFTSDVKLEKVSGMPVAIISPQTYQQIVLFLGGKTTLLGDDVTQNGYVGWFMGFNLFMTNTLPCSVSLTLAAVPSNNDTFTINGLTFTFVNSIGSTAGNMLIQGSAANQQSLLTNVIANLFSNQTSGTGTLASSANWVPFANTATNQIKLANLAIGAWATNVATISQSGIGVMTLTSVTLTSASNVFGKVVQHNIFGVSKSVALALQGFPRLFINNSPVNSSGVSRVGKDYVTWCYYGIKVFKYMTTQLIDVWVDATSFTQPQLIAN